MITRLFQLRLLQRFEAARPFTEAEAWLLFRLAAFGEACGWTLLIGGIAISRYGTPGNDIAVQIAGQIHGTIFLCYLAASVVLYPSLGWPRWRAGFALACSLPPYGTLLFEQWAANRRHNAGFKNYQQFLLYMALVAQT